MKNKKNIELVGLLKNLENMGTIKLSQTEIVKNTKNKDVRDFLSALYGNVDPLINKMASVMNSILFQKKVAFILSKRIATELIRADKNVSSKTISSSMYRLMIYKLTESLKFIERIREPTTNKAGVFILKQPEFLQLLYLEKGKEYYEAQKIVTLDLYDNYEAEVDPTVTKKKKKVRSFSEMLNKGLLDQKSSEEVSSEQ